jgi:hypothetical protein
MMTRSYSGTFAPDHLSGVIAGIATVSTSFPRSFFERYETPGGTLSPVKIANLAIFDYHRL